MEIEWIAKLINEIGFPIVVAVYLAIRIDPLVHNINANIIRLNMLLEMKLKEGRDDS